MYLLLFDTQQFLNRFDVPVILMGVEFWIGLKEWMTTTMLEDHHNISPKDLSLLPMTDDPEEVLSIIGEFYEGEGHAELEPNYTLL